MSSLIFNNQKAKNIFYNGNSILPQVSSNSVRLNTVYDLSMISYYTWSTYSIETSGYSIQNIVVRGEEQFELYSQNDLNNKLTSIPNGYKFLLVGNNLQIDLTSKLQLIQDPNTQLFSLNSSININELDPIYISDKFDFSNEVAILLLDNQNKLLYTNSTSNLLYLSANTDEASTNFTKLTFNKHYITNQCAVQGNSQSLPDASLSANNVPPIFNLIQGGSGTTDISVISAIGSIIQSKYVLEGV